MIHSEKMCTGEIHRKNLERITKKKREKMRKEEK